MRRLLALASGVVVILGSAGIGPSPAGAQSAPEPAPSTDLEGSGSTSPSGGSPDTSVSPLRSPTTLADEPLTDNCSPGNIVRRPDCGREATDAGDPGGWLQVSLFFLTCAVIGGMVGFIWWRSRLARGRRRSAGLDPVEVAPQAARRRIRSEPVADTSSNRPEASAGL